MPRCKALLNGGPRGLAAYRAGSARTSAVTLSPSWDVPLLHRRVFRDYPVVPAPVDRAQIADPPTATSARRPRVFTLNWASATGTAILLAALATALFLRVPLAQLLSVARADGPPHALRRSRRSC